jgi:hypothetical protein
MIIKTNRPKPRVQILRGWDLVSTSTLHQVHAVKAGQEDIKSGMIISRVWNATLSRYEWTKGVTANGLATPVPYIAFQDATEADVVAAEGLTGISISGDYEIQTGYYSSGTYNADVLLTFDATTGSVKPAVEGSYVIGRVTRNQGVRQLNPTGVALFYENSETTPANSNVITFETSNMGFVQAVDAITTSTP